MGLPDIPLQQQQKQQQSRSQPVHEPGEQAADNVETPSCHSAHTLDSAAVYGDGTAKNAQQHDFTVELADLSDDNAAQKQSQPPPLRRPRSSFGDQQALYVGSHDFRGDFVRKVYTLLSMQMALTIGVMCFCMFYAVRAAFWWSLALT